MRSITVGIMLMLMAIIGLTGCWPFEKGHVTTPTSPTEELQVFTELSGDASSPQSVLTGPSAALAAWSDRADGEVTQLTLASRDGQSLVLVDVSHPEDGIRIWNKQAQEGLIMRPISLSEVLCLRISKSGSEWALEEAIGLVELPDGKFYRGSPSLAAFSGQITGQMMTSSNELLGSFVLVADGNQGGAYVYQQLEELRSEEQGLMHSLSRVGAVADARGGSASITNLPTALRVVGGAALVLGATGALAPAYAAAGAVMLGISFVPGLLAERVADFRPSVNELDPSDPGYELANESLNIVVEHLRDPLVDDLADFRRRIGDSIDRMADWLAGENPGPRETPTIAPAPPQTSPDSPLPPANPDLLPPTTLEPAPANTDVSGHSVDRDGHIRDLDGMIDSNGNLSASGIGPDGEVEQYDGSLQGQDVSGSYMLTQNGSGSSGSFSGTTQQLGSCNESGNSGGAGTYLFVHNMGQTSGSVDFSFDAFSIPDGFTVRGGNGTLFTTGGVVSGSSSTLLNFAGSSYVYVAVFAPDTDTQWTYQIGCP